MKIAIIGSRENDSMESNLHEAFSFAGHDTRIYDIYDLKRFSFRSIDKITHTLDKLCRVYSDSYDKKLFHALFLKVKEFSPDLVVCVYRFIHPSFVDLCKNQGAKVIHVNPDQMTTLEYQQVFASNYDIWFVKDPYMLSFMRNNMRLNVMLYNEAFNPRIHKKTEGTKVECERKVAIDVMTYGTMYPYRCRMLKSVVDSGVDMKIYGVIPHRFYSHQLDAFFQHQYITGSEKSEILFGSKIVFNQMHFAEVESVNCRFFEANGCGAFQLSDYRPILKELLPINPELVSFKSVNDGIDKIKYYLKHDEERYEIANEVYNHFINHYTYDHLVNHIINNTF